MIIRLKNGGDGGIEKEKRQSVDPTLFVGVSRDPTHDLFTVLSGLCLCVGAAF